MIVKAKERGGGPQLARYLLSMRDNDHVELHEVRGFVSDDLLDAFREGPASGPGEARPEQHQGDKLMALFLVTRPKGAEHHKNPSGIHAAIVDAANGPAAILAANALAPRLNAPFAGYDTTQVAATAAGGFVPAIVQGDVLGSDYSGPGRGA